MKPLTFHECHIYIRIIYERHIWWSILNHCHSQLKPITRNIFQTPQVPLYITYISAIFLSSTETHTYIHSGTLSKSTVHITVYKMYNVHCTHYLLYSIYYTIQCIVYTPNSIFIFIQTAVSHTLKFRQTISHLHILRRWRSWRWWLQPHYICTCKLKALHTHRHTHTRWKINDFIFKCFIWEAKSHYAKINN